MTPIRSDTTLVAVIGLGAMGKYHAKIYNDLPEAQIVGLAEVDPDAAKIASENLSMHVYTDYHKMLATERPQVVSVTVPTALHEEVTIAALESGAHVIVEKPITTNLESGARMLACARRNNRQLTIGHLERFNPVLQRLKSELDNNRLGQIHQIICRRTSPYPSRVQDVGVVMDLAIHDLDLVYFLTNQQPDSVYAQINHHLGGQHEDTLIGTLHYQKGFSCLLDINWLSPLKVREILIFGERGLLHANTLIQGLTFHTKKQRQISLPVPHANPLKIELQTFLQTVKGKTPLRVSGEEGLLALYVALTLLESGRSHQSQAISFDLEALVNETTSEIIHSPLTLVETLKGVK